jgi:hypothetical protein
VAGYLGGVSVSVGVGVLTAETGRRGVDVGKSPYSPGGGRGYSVEESIDKLMKVVVTKVGG